MHYDLQSPDANALTASTYIAQHSSAEHTTDAKVHLSSELHLAFLLNNINTASSLGSAMHKLLKCKGQSEADVQKQQNGFQNPLRVIFDLLPKQVTLYNSNDYHCSCTATILNRSMQCLSNFREVSTLKIPAVNTRAMFSILVVSTKF